MIFIRILYMVTITMGNILYSAAAHMGGTPIIQTNIAEARIELSKQLLTQEMIFLNSLIRHPLALLQNTKKLIAKKNIVNRLENIMLYCDTIFLNDFYEPLWFLTKEAYILAVKIKKKLIYEPTLAVIYEEQNITYPFLRTDPLELRSHLQIADKKIAEKDLLNMPN